MKMKNLLIGLFLLLAVPSLSAQNKTTQYMLVDYDHLDRINFYVEDIMVRESNGQEVAVRWFKADSILGMQIKPSLKILGGGKLSPSTTEELSKNAGYSVVSETMLASDPKFYIKDYDVNQKVNPNELTLYVYTEKGVIYKTYTIFWTFDDY